MATSATRVKVTSPFWRRYQRLVKEAVLPYQWDVLTDSIAIDLPAVVPLRTFEWQPAGQRAPSWVFPSKIPTSTSG